MMKHASFAVAAVWVGLAGWPGTAFAQPASAEVVDAGVAQLAAEPGDAGGTGDATVFDGGMGEPGDAGTSQTAQLLSAAQADAGALRDGLELVDAGRPVAAPSLETVVVGTPEERTAGSAHTIKSARLNRFELDDPHAVLQAVPGVQVRGEDGYGLRPNIGLRGANPDRSKKVTLMEDGVLFGPAPYSAPAAYYFPLVTRMESIRVLKGPSSIMYGPQTVGGAIDFITRDIPQGVSAGFDGSFGQYQSGKLHGYFSASSEQSGFLVEGLHLRSSGFKQLDGGGDTGFQRNEWMMKGRHQLTAGGATHTFSIKLGFSHESSNETYLGLSDADFRAAPLRRYVSSRFDHMEWYRTQLVLTHKLSAGPITVSTDVYRQDLHRTWRKLNHFRGAELSDVLSRPDTARNQVFYSVLTGQQDSQSDEETLLIGPNQRDFISQGVQSVLRTGFKTGPIEHAVEARARYHFDSIRRHHSEDAFLMRSGQLVFAGEPTAQLVDNYEFTHAVALNVADALSWGPVTLTPGVRVELIWSQSNDYLANTVGNGATQVVLPGLGAHWAITPQLGVLAGIYRGFSPPAPGQPPQVLPELSWNMEAGARWARPKERFEVIGFFNDYQNLTDICTFSNGCANESLDRQFSAGEANIYGAEVFGEKTLRFGSLVSVPLSLAYTFTQTRLLQSYQSQDPVLGQVQAGDELPYVPRHQLNVAAGIDVWRIGVHGQFTFIDRMREVAGQGEYDPRWATDALPVLDLHAGFKLTDWAELYFDARNVLDSHAIVGRRPFGARPNAPRTMLGGLKLHY